MSAQHSGTTRRRDLRLVAVAVLAGVLISVGAPVWRSLNPTDAAGNYIWISPAEVASLPMSGPAWTQMLAAANATVTPNISNQDDNSDVQVLAKALVYARTGDPVIPRRG